MPTIRVSHEFHGHSDFWGGNGRRWDDNAGCLFGFYGPDTSLADCVDQWIDDFCMGGDCDSFAIDISESELREAILTDLFNDRGRADYASGALCEFAADCEDNRECRECGASIGCEHEEDCGYFEDGADVEPDHCDDDDCYELPVWIILVELETDENDK